MRCLHGRHLDNPARFAEAARRVDYKKTDSVQKRLHLVRTALCEQARLRIVQALGAGELSVGDLAIVIESARPATSQHLRVLRDLGVVEVIDYTTTRFEDVARDVDLVFDTVAGELTERSFAVLKPGGIYVTAAGQPDPEAAAGRGVRASGMLAQANPTDLTEIASLIDASTVKPVVSTVLPLAEARRAHELLEAGHTRGKIVLRVVA